MASVEAVESKERIVPKASSSKASAKKDKESVLGVSGAKEDKVLLDSDELALKPVYSPPVATKAKGGDIQGLPTIASKLSLDDVVISSDLQGLSTDELTKKILERFNKGGNVCFTKNAVRGTQINRVRSFFSPLPCASFTDPLSG